MPQGNANRKLDTAPSNHKTEKPSDPPHDWIEFMNAISTLVIAVFAVVTVVALFYQITTTRRSERPWLSVDRVGNPPENWIEQTKSGYVPGVILEFKLHGKTVVRITEARFVFCIVPAKTQNSRPEPDLPPTPDYTNIVAHQIAGKNRMVVAPDAVFQIHELLKGGVPPATELEAVRDGKKVMCAYGFIRYKDAFEEDRETRACYVYDFSWGGVLRTPDRVVLNPAGFRPGGPSAYNGAT
jgi:hypothetical protein